MRESRQWVDLRHSALAPQVLERARRLPFIGDASNFRRWRQLLVRIDETNGNTPAEPDSLAAIGDPMLIEF